MDRVGRGKFAARKPRLLPPPHVHDGGRKSVATMMPPRRYPKTRATRSTPSPPPAPVSALQGSLMDDEHDKPPNKRLRAMGLALTPSAVAMRRRPLINIPTPCVGEDDTANRLRFFIHRPRAWGAYATGDCDVLELSPFAHASFKLGNGTDEVCATCGGSNGLSFKCRTCALVWHAGCARQGTDGQCMACSSTPSAHAGEGALAVLTADAAGGNSCDMVLHPGLLGAGIGGSPRYEADWLRCGACDQLRVVVPGVVSEVVLAPFTCRKAFWLKVNACKTPQPDPATVDALEAQIELRVARRRRLFARFGATNPALFGCEVARPRAHPHPQMNAQVQVAAALPYKAAAPAGSAGAGANVALDDKELARTRMLSLIARMPNLGPLEDILVDLALTLDPILLHYYRAFSSTPELFNRQAIRMARVIHDKRSGGVGGGEQAPRAMGAREGYELYEGFRHLRLRQIEKLIRLEHELLRETRECPNENLPRLYSHHVAERQRLDNEHKSQIAAFWRSRTEGRL